MYRGHSFIATALLEKPFHYWEDKIDLQKEDKDAKQIIQSYLRNCKAPRIIQL
jgi:hypothetical protein